MSTSKVYTDGQLAEIMARRARGETYNAVAAALNKTYDLDTSAEAVRRAVNKYGHLFEVGATIGSIKVLKEVARVKRANSQVAKENRTILAALNSRDDVVAELKAAIAEMEWPAAAPNTPPPADAAKTDMTVEALISDVHVGKLTDTFNLEVCRARLRRFTVVLLEEIERKKKHYNVQRIVLGLLGDLIENALMHGRESAMGCEFGNPEQVRHATTILFQDVILPLAWSGITLDVVCITGNHDREEERPTFNNPGKNSLTWVIYNTLKMLCDQASMTWVNWHIPEGVYAVLDIYGDYVLYEHGDRIRGGNDKKSFLTHMAKRSAQLGIMLKGMRVGHWHEVSVLDNGAVIVNGSVPGQDSYADVQGYRSIPSQVITYYVSTKNRPSSYYCSFPVQL